MGTLKHNLSWSSAGLLAAALACALSGCTAISNPVADGIPVRLLPPELIGPSKCNWQTIPLNALEQPSHDVYRLAARDVLGVYIDGYLGAITTPIPVQAAPPILMREQYRLPPAAGYPVTVQHDGTIALPSVPNLKVDGMTVAEAGNAIKKLYVDRGLIKADNERILVTLLYPRQTQVLVFRQEATSFTPSPDGPLPTSKRNTAFTVDLPAPESDVLHALARSGGLPDLDAYNEIIIYRDYLRGRNPQIELKQLEKGKPPQRGILGETVRLPLRLPEGAPIPFGPDDVVLRTGDVVFIEARDEQVFYTGGLLPPGKHMIPRDHDLDVLDAVAMVHGPLYNGAWGGSNLSGQLIQPGLGSPSPSLVVVVRRVPGRGQVAIAVDLRSALQHPQERIPIRPGDMVLLQEKPAEAFARYVTQTFLNFEMMLNIFNSNNGFGVLDIAGPDRLPTRPALFNQNQ